jgi:hypothetical protein
MDLERKDENSMWGIPWWRDTKNSKGARKEAKGLRKEGEEKNPVCVVGRRLEMSKRSKKMIQ